MRDLLLGLGVLLICPFLVGGAIRLFVATIGGEISPEGLLGLSLSLGILLAMWIVTKINEK